MTRSDVIVEPLFFLDRDVELLRRIIRPTSTLASDDEVDESQNAVSAQYERTRKNFQPFSATARAERESAISRNLLIPPQISVSSGGEEFSPSLRRRGPRFLYMVTKTQTEYRTRFTDTLSITFKCTPSKHFIPICGCVINSILVKTNF